MFELNFVFFILVVTYLSILFEIVVLPVPSVASTYQLLFVNKVDAGVLKFEKDGLLRKTRQLPLLLKLGMLLIPTVLSVLNFVFPISVFFIPLEWVDMIIIHELKSTFVLITAVLFILAGRIIAIGSVINIRNKNTQQDDSFDLKTSGIFGFSRNPILIGMYICYWGIFLLVPNWITLLGFILYSVNMHFRILLEEDFLRSMFGDKFDKYFDNTRRYI
ncbi:methyltransferase family protein [Agaribacter marinus]|uniref:Isoprenylcysteine carboxylmethyltransferase family protein n=1 Tax=Agaribacter marinus TaxID=1431249 RepID=A0AA37SWY2_9ALTE|nr:isoprenylcysteine carboxylmethyltransferase family protein [Agaribacter marinus]GLR71316.1 hypothetical protein GCM10007852_22240 [Agaribacter marinus]